MESPASWVPIFGKTSLLTAAAALLAGMADGDVSNCEGALGEFLLSEDIARPSIQHATGGRLSLADLWHKPGLVDEVSRERLERYTFRYHFDSYLSPGLCPSWIWFVRYIYKCFQGYALFLFPIANWLRAA